MADIYITNTGLEKPMLAECVQEIGDALEGVVGPVNREADSTTGQWIGVEAEANTVHFEALEHLWNSRFLSTATGAALDAIGTWFGVARNGRTATQANAVIYGTESTLVPAGSLASFGNHNFALQEDAVISRSSLVDGQFRIGSLDQSAYTVRIDGADLSYTRKNEDTLATVAKQIAALIDQSQKYIASSSGAVVSLTSESKVQGYPVSLEEGMTWVKIGSPALFTATEKGAVVVPVGGLNTPVSAIPGWTGVTNLVAGSAGSDRESDTAYRNRLRNARSANNGSATESAISARLLNEVAGVTLAVVLENDTMKTVDDMPPKSIQCIVAGGLEQDVADAIWKYKAAGIETYGTTNITVRDSHGQSHVVGFSRPVNLTIYVRVAVTLLDDEEELPVSVVKLIKDGVKAYFSTLSLGSDVITQRMYGYIYEKTTGIGKLTITVSSNGTDFSEQNISVPVTAYATVSDENIEVTGV